MINCKKLHTTTSRSNIVTLFLQTAKYQGTATDDDRKDKRERNPKKKTLIESIKAGVPLITQQTHIVGN